MVFLNCISGSMIYIIDNSLQGGEYFIHLHTYNYLVLNISGFSSVSPIHEHNLPVQYVRWQ